MYEHEPISRLEVPFFESQGSFFGKLNGLKSKDRDHVVTILLNLDETDLKILLTVLAFDGIGAKALGQKVHISRYTALARASQLVEANLLTAEKIPSPKTGIKPAYSYHIAPGLTKEAIEAVIRQKELGSLALLDQNNAIPRERVASTSQAEPFEQTATESQIPDFSTLKLCLSSLTSKTLPILTLVSRSNGITANDIAQRTNQIKQAVHPRVKKLMELGLLSRKEVARTTGKEYIYFLSPSLTPEVIEAALAPSKLKEAKLQLEQESSNHVEPNRAEEVSRSTTRSTESNSVAFVNGNGSYRNNRSDHVGIERSQSSLSDTTTVEAEISSFNLIRGVVSQLNPLALLILKLVAKSGEITSKAILDQINFSPPAINGAIEEILERNLITYKEYFFEDVIEHIYFPAPGLTSEVIDATLEPSQPEEQVYPVEDVPASNSIPAHDEVSCSDKTHKLMPTEEPHQPQSTSTSSAKTIEGMLVVLKELTQKVVELEDRFTRLEHSLQAGSDINPEELLAILRSKKS
jgi:predicted transcriptional regulator